MNKLKRRIEQLLNGKFEYQTSKLLLDPGALHLEVQPGGRVRGSFRVLSASGEKVRGFLYASSPRMLFEPAEFHGSDVEIHFQADASGMESGTTENGVFSICSELGEYSLTYTLAVAEEDEGETEIPADSGSSLAELAHRDFEKAYRCFITPEFGRKLAEDDPELAVLYETIAKASFRYQSLEEFLNGAGFKDPVEITADTLQLERSSLSEPVMESIRLTRSGWGFAKIEPRSDVPFLRLEKTLITTDEFAGSTYDLRFLLDTNRMHAGINYGRIRISTDYQTFYIEVMARRTEEMSHLHQRQICRKMRCRLENLYIAFRLQKMGVEAWIDGSVKAIDNYTGAGGEDPFADLFLVQLCYADDKRQKAVQILDRLQEHPERFSNVTQYGFYLYLTTFFSRDPSYVDQVESQITQMLADHPSDWVLQWILMYLNEKLLKEDDAKYDAVAAQFSRGCRSRIMYLEAYQILQKNPYYMHRLGAFELQLLRFAAKEQVLTEEVLQQTVELAGHISRYDDTLFHVLTVGYESHPSRELLKAICLLLMKGDKKDGKYFPWYEKGVEEGLRITGLYEYYMASMDYTSMSELPQIIQMYFVYDNLLDYRKRASIYESILRQRDTDPQMYRAHRSAMQKFTLEQLEAGHLTDALAGLYRGLLRRDTLTRSMAEKLLRMLSSYDIVCEAPEMKYLVVHSPAMKEEEIVPLSGGRARVQIYDPCSVVMVVDGEECRHPAQLLCGIIPVFEDEMLMQWCMEKQPESAAAALYVSSRSLQKEETAREELPFLQAAERQSCFADVFRRRLRARILSYYQGHLLDDTLSDYLRSIEIQEFAEADKTGLIVLLAEEGMCEEAFDLLNHYGAEGIPLIQLVRICSRMVIACEFEENRMLLSLCHTCFEQGKYNDKLLRYLLLYYEGTVQEMRDIWQAGCEFELDTLMIEEKIMMMVLFTRSQTQEAEPVFEVYLKKIGRRKLCRAYVNLRAYEYFVKGRPVGKAVFRFMEQEYESCLRKGKPQEQEDVCRLALLQYYSGRPSLDERQEKRVIQLLEEYNTKGMRFAFWKKFPDRLLAPYQMEGREFVEYVCSPERQVFIYYRRKGQSEYHREAVKNYFEGIFVKEFTLFAGETLECYLEEQSEEGTIRTDDRILTAAAEESAGYTQYEILNRMILARDRQDDKALREELENFLLQEYLAKEIFTLI